MFSINEKRYKYYICKHVQAMQILNYVTAQREILQILHHKRCKSYICSAQTKNNANLTNITSQAMQILHIILHMYVQHNRKTIQSIQSNR